MGERKGKTVKLRVSEDMYNRLMMQGDNVSATIRGLITEGLERNPERRDLMDKAVERELRRQARGLEISTHDLFRGVSELIDKGKIFYERGRLRTHGNLDTRVFEEECYKRGAAPQKIIDRMVQNLAKY